MPRLLLAVTLSVVPWAGARAQGGREVGTCRPCHQEIVDSFTQTAHYWTSAEASARSVRGDFSRGHNVLRTRAQGVYFKMEPRSGSFYQTGVDSGLGRSLSERIDLVIGSGRRGQTYLYWRSGLLFELPVSYLTGPKRWINSPGYVDGQIDFGRLIVPRCLECHSASFSPAQDRRVVRYGRDYVLGISCETCHGAGQAHVRFHASHPGETHGTYIINPAGFSRDRKVDNCALCHSGERDPKQPPFSYRPGLKLDDYLVPSSARETPVPDVHGNQVALLQRSKCFRFSRDMSCTTCHDVHRPQRDVTWFAQKCVGCHQTGRHPMADEIGDRMLTSCIDCHMPNRESNAIQITTPTRRLALYFRSHAIGIYPDVAATVLHANSKTTDR